jgi:hypothetical protein
MQFYSSGNQCGGPVILGAGRFVGLGLCRALDLPERGA